MNKLPHVLQNEIWEYVRGDRAYWKRKHSRIINEFFPAFRNKHYKTTLSIMQDLATAKRKQKIPDTILVFSLEFPASRVTMDTRHSWFRIAARQRHSTTKSFPVAMSKFLEFCREMASLDTTFDPEELELIEEEDELFFEH